jgi:urocanate hydratase
MLGSTMDRITTSETVGYQPVRAPRGTAISCKSWQQEAVLRMLMNSLDPEVADKPEKLIVCARSKAARNWECFHAIFASLRSLGNDETLLLQSGKPVGIFRTNTYAPRVLAANAGSWFYIGAQGILREAFEVFAAAGRKHFQGNFAGKLIVSGGMGARGGVQPLAATLNGAAFLGIDADPEQIKRRVKTGYCDVMVNDLDEALRILKNAVRKREATSVGLVGNCADVIPALARRGIVPALLTDQTNTDDPGCYIPQGLNVMQAAELRERDPEAYRTRALESISRHADGIRELRRLGSVVFNYGNNDIGTFTDGRDRKNTEEFPGFVREYLSLLYCEGRGPLRVVALSGEPGDIHRIDKLLFEMSPVNESLTRWVRLAQKRVRFQGLPARACWLGCGEVAKFGVALNELVARGELKAPVAIGRGQLDRGSVASPYGEAKDMRDGSDSVADWPLLNALLNVASGATWVNIDNGAVEGVRYSLGTSYVVVADGTPEMAERIERVLTNDSGFGVARRADAGYSDALEFARGAGITIPMPASTAGSSLSLSDEEPDKQPYKTDR